MKVVELVKEVFKDKVDKAGKPYIFHLERVAKSAYDSDWMTYEEREMLYQVGLLHDILEDTNITVERLCEIEGVTKDIIDIVKILTRGDETYDEYIERVSHNKYATIIKKIDLLDNMNVTRFDNFDDVSISLLKRYHKAYKFLQKVEFLNK